MMRVHSTCASGARAIAVPECPESACSGASMARPQITLIPNWTSAGSCTTGGYGAEGEVAAWVMPHPTQCSPILTADDTKTSPHASSPQQRPHPRHGLRGQVGAGALHLAHDGP